MRPAIGWAFSIRREGDTSRAEEAYRKAIALGNANAAFNLGMLYTSRDLDKAREAFRLGLELGHSESAHALSLLLSDPSERMGVYQRSVELGSGLTDNLLGQRFWHEGGREIAESIFRHALEAGDANAAVNFGQLLEQRGESLEATTVYRRGLELGSGRAAFHLGVVYEKQRDLGGAKQFYQTGMQMGDGYAASRLGVILSNEGDSQGAERALRKGVELGAGEAAHSLGVFYHEKDVEQAKEAYRIGMELGYTPSAYQLGLLLTDPQDRAAAYRKGVESGLAAMELEQLTNARGDSPGAGWLRVRVMAGGETAANLPLVLKQQGDLTGAQDAFRQGVLLGSGRAALNLGVYLEQRGDVAKHRRLMSRQQNWDSRRPLQFTWPSYVKTRRRVHKPVASFLAFDRLCSWLRPRGHLLPASFGNKDRKSSFPCRKSSELAERPPRGRVGPGGIEPATFYVPFMRQRSMSKRPVSICEAMLHVRECSWCSLLHGSCFATRFQNSIFPQSAIFRESPKSRTVARAARR